MAVKVNFDVKKSMQEASPSKYYSKYKGVRFVKRIVTRLDNIDPDINNQIRNQVYDLENVKQLAQTFNAYGYIYTETPMQVVANTRSNALIEFRLINGFCRYDAQTKELNWESTMVDVLEFDSPLDQFRFALQANHIKTPAGLNRAGDIAKGVMKMIQGGMIEPDISEGGAVYQILTEVVEPHREDVFKKAFAMVSESVNYANTAHLPLCGNRAKKLANKLGVPCNAEKDLGYVKNSGGSKNIFWDAMQLHLETGETISLAGYIQDPLPKKLVSQRKTWLRQFHGMIEFWQKMCERATGIKPAKKDFPIKFIGFLPQNETPDPSKGGRPTEESLILPEEFKDLKLVA